MLDAIDERVLQSLVSGNGDEVAAGKLVHVAVVALAEGLVLGLVADLISVHEAVVGAGLGEEFDDERNGIHQHEQQGEDDVGVVSEFTALVSGFEQPVERERLSEDVAAGFVAHGLEADTFLCSNGGEFLLSAIQFHEAGVDLELDGFAQGVLLGDELPGLVLFDLLFKGGDAFFLGFVLEFDLGELGFKSSDGTFLGLAGEGLEIGFLGG